MMKKIIYTTLAVLTLLVGIALLQTPEALAAPKDQICAGVNVVSGGSGCTAGDAQVNKIVDAIINVFSIVVGITAVIMIMVGGFKFVTANGDAGAVASARKTIAYAFVGLVVVAMAQFIVQFVLNKL